VCVCSVLSLLSRVQCLVHVDHPPFGDGKSWPVAPTLGIHSPQRAICFEGMAQARGRAMEASSLSHIRLQNARICGIHPDPAANSNPPIYRRTRTPVAALSNWAGAGRQIASIIHSWRPGLGTPHTTDEPTHRPTAINQTDAHPTTKRETTTGLWPRISCTALLRSANNQTLPKKLLH
jgi:hypothetical protein